MAEQWWDSWVPEVRPYAILLSRFVDASLSADEFEIVFTRLYLQDPTEWSPEMFDVLDGFFADVDEYTSDDGLRAELHSIDEAALRERGAQTLRSLRDLAG